MSKKLIKNEGPSCACGKADLYEVWLQNENTKEKIVVSQKTPDSSTANTTDKVTQKKNSINNKNA